MNSERRQYSRFEVPEGALALDETGRQLGHVTVAGGGGMAIALDQAVPSFASGQRLLLTIVEPALNARHSIDVVVRRQDEHSIGVEFVRGESA